MGSEIRRNLQIIRRNKCVDVDCVKAEAKMDLNLVQKIFRGLDRCDDNIFINQRLLGKLNSKYSKFKTNLFVCLLFFSCWMLVQCLFFPLFFVTSSEPYTKNPCYDCLHDSSELVSRLYLTINHCVNPSHGIDHFDWYCVDWYHIVFVFVFVIVLFCFVLFLFLFSFVLLCLHCQNS